MGFDKDIWHREAGTVAQRNAVNPRRWGQRVTVYNDGANSGEYVLTYNLSSPNKNDNNNWLKVADINAPWGGGAVNTPVNGFTGEAFVVWEPQPSLTATVFYPQYYISGQSYTPGQNNVTLDPADPTNPRFDLIVVDNTNQATKITGTPSANPDVPTYDPATQLLVTIVSIPAGANSPGGVAEEVVYNENVEFVVSSNNGTVNPASTNGPLVGSLCIETGAVNNTHYIDFTDGATHDANNFVLLKIPINQKAQFVGVGTFFSVQLFNGANPVSSIVPVTNNAYNFNRLTTGSYQFVLIPLSAFTFSSTVFNRIRIAFGLSNATGVKFDYIVFQQGTVINGGTATNPGGGNMAVQFNNNGTFGGDASLIWDNANKILKIGQLGTTNPGFVFTPGTLNFTATDPTKDFNISHINALLSGQAGGSVGIYAGGAIGGNANGGNITISPGLRSGSGTNGKVVLHQVTKIINANTLPSAGEVDSVLIYSKDVAGSSELFTYNEAGQERKISGQPEAATGTAIDFATEKIFNSPASPATGNITDTLTAARTGIIQKIYHNAGSAPTFPAGWVRLGTGAYVTSALNIIFAEWVSGTRVEYWITQPA